jgi:predicted enzyme related to lactoylglutathione lyase
MANPVVHFEIRSSDPDAARIFFGQVFDWQFSPGAIPGYTFVEHGVEGAIPGAIGPTQGGPPIVTFFVAVDDVAATLTKAESLGGKTIQPAVSVPGITFGAFADPQGQVVGIVKHG